MSISAIYPSTDHITDENRLNRLYQAVDGFEGSSELSKQVYHIGKPYFTDSCATASLGMGHNGINFNFNRNFFDNLGPSDLIFVLLHETLHYALRHHQRCHDRVAALWNIACDLVINALLLNRFGFNQITSASFITFLQSAITFENLPIVPKGQQLSVTAEEVYNLLDKGRKHLSAKSATLQACDEHTWLDSYRKGSPQEVDLANDIARQAQKIFRESTPTCGHQALGELRILNSVNPSPGVAWDKILRFRIASCIDEATEQRWAPPNRRIAWLYPDILLPTERLIEKPLIMVLLAIDGSGSIAPQVLDRLVAMARSIPREKVKLSTISFDTKAYPIDIFDNSYQVYGGGGTSFDAVEKFAKQSKSYPDLIAVLTDGVAPEPKVRFPDRWFWLITADGVVKNIEGIGRHCKINN